VALNNNVKLKMKVYIMKTDSKCDKMNVLKYPLDRQGTLYIDGEIHSTGLFDLISGLFVPSSKYRFDIPVGNAIVLIADDGERIDIDRILICPSGEAHYHFGVE